MDDRVLSSCNMLHDESISCTGEGAQDVPHASVLAKALSALRMLGIICFRDAGCLTKCHFSLGER